MANQDDEKEPPVPELWNLIIDVDNCTNCNACVLACLDEFNGNEFPGYAAEMPKHGHNWIDIRQKVRGTAPHIDVAYLPVPCQHCDAAPCIAAADNDAVAKRNDGIVLIDPVKAKGQKQLVEACPYGAIVWNEEKQLPQHWIFDAHLIDAGWKEPRAAQVCATQAIRAVKVTDEEMAQLAANDGLKHLNPEFETKPRVWYKNLHRYTHAFIAGSVETERDGIVDCNAGASIALIRDGETLATATSDAFGDFKFDHIDENSGAHQIRITTDGREPRIVDVEVIGSVSVGDIRL